VLITAFRVRSLPLLHPVCTLILQIDMNCRDIESSKYQEFCFPVFDQDIEAYFEIDSSLTKDQNYLSTQSLCNRTIYGIIFVLDENRS